MATKKQTVKEEVKPIEHKRDNSNDIAIMMACIMQSLDEIKRYLKALETYERLDHGGEI
jgi:hypothetical protein